MPFSRTGIISNGGALNTGNLIDGLVPTFSGWNINPGTNAEIASEDKFTLTTSGVQTNAVASTITYDLGSILRLIISAYRHSVATTAYFDLVASLDNIDLNRVSRSPTSTLIMAQTAVVRARYIQVSFSATAAGNTHAGLYIRAYKI